RRFFCTSAWIGGGGSRLRWWPPEWRCWRGRTGSSPDPCPAQIDEDVGRNLSKTSKSAKRLRQLKARLLMKVCACIVCAKVRTVRRPEDISKTEIAVAKKVAQVGRQGFSGLHETRVFPDKS